MPELAVGYVSLVAETSKMGPAIKRALGQADGDAAAAGKSMGSKMSSALGTALKGGVATAGAAALGGIGFALTKGFSRLNTIDQAQAKLRALGSSGTEVESIMKSALASVKGTAFGLGDAAGLAGTMVAAGIKPGQELEKTLRLVADSAAIAGTDLNDMGMIYGKIAAKGKLDGETLDQLMERQIGILPELAKNYGVTTEEAAKMVSEGKVSFEDFAKVMTEKVGGGAEEMGQTVQGAFENMKAAAGRIGATALEPIFKALPGGFSGITEAMDALEPKIGAFVEMISNKAVTEFGPKIRESAMAAWQALEGAGVIDQTRDTFMQLINTGQQLAPTVVRIATSIASVSASLGVGTWQVFMAALSGVASVMSALEPVFSAIADVMEAQPALVGAAIIGWMAFRSVPGMVTRVGTVTSSLTQKLSGLVRASALSAESQSALATASTNLAKAQATAATAAAKTLIAEENLARVRATAGATAGQVAAAEARVAEARLASTTAATRATAAQAGMTAAQQAAAAQTRTFGSDMRNAYSQGSAAATRFHRTNGMVTAGFAGMSKAGAGLMGMMGGPWGLAMIGAGVGIMAVTSKLQESKRRTEEAQKAAEAYTGAVAETGRALRASRGVVDDNVFAAVGKQIEAMKPKLESARSAVKDLGFSDDQIAKMDLGAQSVESTLSKIGYSTEDLAKKASGSRREWDSFVAELQKQGVGDIQIAQLQGMRTEFEKQQAIAKMTTAGVTEFGEAIKVMGDESATAETKLNAIKAAMDALNPQRTKAEAMRQMGDAIRQATKAAEGIGPEAIKANGAIDDMSESGGKLGDVLEDLAQKQQQVAATRDPEALAQANRKIEASLQSLATSTKQPIEKIRELFTVAGGGENVNLLVQLEGAPEAIAGLGAVKAAINRTPGRKDVTVEYDQVKTALPVLDQLGVKYTEVIKNGQKAIKIDVTGGAGQKIQQVIDATTLIPANKPISITAPGGPQVRAFLDDIGVKVNRDNRKEIEVLAPLAPGVKDMLAGIGLEVQTNNGKTVIVRQEGAEQTRSQLDQTKASVDAIPNEKNVTVRINEVLSGSRVLSGLRVPDNADGSIRRYAAGGIRAAEAYANGGMRGDTLPDRALIQRADPGGGLVQWAEPSTAGEAFIPLAPGKRSRSTAILAAVAKMFGLELIPRDGSISGLLGGIAGGAVTKLLAKAGADGLTKFADGGIQTADSMKRLIQPLAGRSYGWGAWPTWDTDCSGAQSIGRNLALTGDPFNGGRFATASQEAALLASGYKMGRAPAGVPAIEHGWVNGGPGGGHTAGTIIDPKGGDVNFEMGGAGGNGQVGGSAAGSRDGQFTHQAWRALGATVEQVTSMLDESLGTDGTSPTYTPSPTSTPDKPTSLSDLVGSAAKTAVAGQASDILGVFGINDSPGALAAWAGLPVKDTTSGKPVDPKKLREAQDSVADKEAALKIARTQLDEVKKSKKPKPSQLLAAQGKVDRLERELGQAKDDLKALENSGTTAPSTSPTTTKPPGTVTVPKAGQDLGTGKLSGVEAIKAAFKQGMREVWRSGDQWTATDWIGNKESGWDPKARNGKYWGIPQAGPEVYRAAGVDPATADPRLQGKTFDHYVDGRYRTPVGAKAHWDQEGWYDVGGVIHEGTTLMKNGLGHKETALPFDPHDLRDRLDRGGSSDETNALLRELIAEIRNADLGTTYATFRDEKEYHREQRQRTRTRAMAGMGGRP
ncbi:tape measure protein [Gordonia malaquae]|uniref:aggregation-promoting factor C-terminal-like domain-containing protein n=1 Tax=Gordonia malaquae TaxID=410332 RepID=UPI0030193772